MHYLAAGRWHGHHTIGLAIIVPSFLLWAVARYQLGTAFTPRARATTLVTHGLYRHLRHPIYTFGLCVTLGLVVFTALPLLSLIPVFLGIVQLRRVRREERVLTNAFGDDYRRYRATTWF